MRFYWINSLARWAEVIDLNARTFGPGRELSQALAKLDDALEEALRP